MLGLISEIGRFRAIKKYHDNVAYNCLLVASELTQEGAKRKVEKVDHSLQSKHDRQHDEYTTLRHAFEKGELVVERYDQSGKLIRKTPPGYLPLDRIAY